MTQQTSTEDTELAKKITIAMYREYERNQDRAAIAKMIKQRFTERYITPLRGDPNRKNGFSLMAISCLMIEALQSFYEGWEDSRGKSQQAFEEFFKANPEFAIFMPQALSFYRGVRCGILHQAETTQGWRIRRKGPLFEPTTRIINATLFHNTLEGSLARYCDRLETEDWESELWQRCRTKLNAICKNCEYAP